MHRGRRSCIDALVGYFERNRNDPRFRITDPLRAAEEFLELLRGYAHLRVLLKIESGPSRREIAARIDGAVRHVLVIQPRCAGAPALSSSEADAKRALRHVMQNTALERG